MAKHRMSFWSCAGKFAFDTLSTARKVAKRMSSRGGSVVAYRCTDCQAWHVGSQTQRRPAKRRGSASSGARR